MQKIFLVLSNVKHNGTEYKNGQLIQEDETESLNILVRDGVLRLLDQAKSISDAEYILEKGKEINDKKEISEKEKEPENTWGPKKDEPEQKVETDVYDRPMAKYKITGDAFYTDENGVRTGSHKIGTIQNLPVEIGKIFVDGGVAEEVVDENVDPSKGKEINDKTPDDNLGDNL